MSHVVLPTDFSLQLDSFTHWLKTANPSSNYVYYEGLHLQENPVATFIAREAWEAYVNGFVYLIQRKRKKVPGCVFEYTAQRSSVPYRNIPPQTVDNGRKYKYGKIA